MKLGRRDVLVGTGALLTTTAARAAATVPTENLCDTSSSAVTARASGHTFNGTYAGEYLEHLAFPLGGIGAGMICLDGRGALTRPSLRHRPDLNSEPLIFAALSCRGDRNFARVLEGPVPKSKRSNTTFHPADSGFPRLRELTFTMRFPFANVLLADEECPLDIEIAAWSPFEPCDHDNSSLPVAALEYTFTNKSSKHLDGAFSFHAENFLKTESSNNSQIYATERGFVLHSGKDSKSPWDEGRFAAWVDDPSVKVNHAWPPSPYLTWQEVERGTAENYRPPQEGSPGASLFVPLSLAPSGRKTIVLSMAWYVGRSKLCMPGGEDFANIENASNTYQPWYAGRFANLAEVIAYWTSHYTILRSNTRRFSDSFYSSTLPPEVLEAVAANLTILKSPTVLRQPDGRVWGWEGVVEEEGSCPGTCTHVWNFAQAMAHLFPVLERGLRETELGPNQDEDGHQVFRSAVPIRPPVRRTRFVAAADGQLGGIVNVYREWRISGDLNWLRSNWPNLQRSIDYCIRTWDPRHRGWLEEPQYNTYDSWLWGPNGRCTSIYLGALRAAIELGKAVRADVSVYETLLSRGLERLETELFDGEYFFQRIEWRMLDAKYPDFVQAIIQPLPPDKVQFYTTTANIPDTSGITEREGPPQQYGTGCLSDGLLGVWMAWAAGVPLDVDLAKVKRHLQSVYRYNFKQGLHAHFNPGMLACAGESGLVVCTWPKGGEPSIPMMYSGQVGFSGVEYQVASHMISVGMVAEGLEIVRAVRARYDGRVRNPFAEIEAGHWYARAMSSYSLLQAFSGARYDAVDGILYLSPTVEGDFRCFLSTNTGYGIVGTRGGYPFLEVVSGTIPYREIRCTPLGTLRQSATDLGNLVGDNQRSTT